MANEQRVHFNFQTGTILDNPLTIGATTLTSNELANFPAVPSNQYAVLTLDPLQSVGPAEIVWVTAHTANATTATILRGQEGSTARAHNTGEVWAHGLTVRDVDYSRNPTSRLFIRANYR